MPTRYLSGSAGAFVEWGRNAARRIGADWERLGLSQPQGAAVVGAFEAFYQAWRVADAPDSRTPLALQRVRESKAGFLATVRPVLAVIQANPATSDEDRVGLRITVRREKSPRVGVPRHVPVLSVEGVRGREFGFRASKAEDEPGARGSRDRLAGAESVVLFRRVGGGDARVDGGDGAGGVVDAAALAGVGAGVG